eukprot:m51a1_g1340 putative casein kinase ii beta subunit 4 (287) ;mRNA; f:320548-321580
MATKAQGSDQSSSESDSQSMNELTWIQWFCGIRGNEFFCEVAEDFIQDEFNLYGLAQVVPNYDYAMDVILDNDPEEDLTDEQEEIVERNAEMLYGLIHARFITTAHGQQLMMDKYKQAEFGRCPRVLCNGQAVLPVGLSDLAQQNTVKLFCPRCQDVYVPKYGRHATIDGAYFGTTFPHLLILQYPEIAPQRPRYQYVPKIFGFKIHSSSPVNGPAAQPQPQQLPSPAQPQQQPQQQQQQQQGQQQSGAAAAQMADAMEDDKAGRAGTAQQQQQRKVSTSPTTSKR